jgi:hypothetical protein
VGKKVIGEAARHLLQVDRERGFLRRETSRLIPAAFAIANLFFSASYENSLRNDLSGYSLSIFLFIQGMIFFAVASGYYVSRSEEILLKTRIFPTTPWSRFVFVSLSNLRRPLTIALWGTDVFVLAVLHRHSVPGLLAAPVFLTLYLAAIQGVTSLVFLVFTRTGHPVSGLAAVAGLVAFGMLLGSIVFRVDSLLALVPLLAWTAEGIRGGGNGEVGSVLIRLVYVSLFIGTVVAAGRRYS